MNQQTLEQMVDQQADLSGVARDAVLGAVLLMADRTPVYIDGLSAWDDALFGKKVRVRGLLRKRSIAPEARVDQDGAVSHGMSGSSNFVIEQASWTVEGS